MTDMIIQSANWSCGSQTVILRPRFPNVSQKNLTTDIEQPGAALHYVQPHTLCCFLTVNHDGAGHFVALISGEDCQLSLNKSITFVKMGPTF